MTQIKMKSKTMFKRSFALFLLWAVVISSLIGCDNREEALELAKAGKEASDTMAKYYETLIQDTYDIWDLEAFRVYSDVEEGTTLSSKQQEEFRKSTDKLRDTTEELNKRLKLAQQLASTYNALQELASYNASGEVKKSVEGLADSIKGLGLIPGAEVVPSSIFGMAAEDLTKWKQSKDIRKGSALIVQTIEKLQELFRKEAEAYRSIPEEKSNKIASALEYLITKEKATSLPLVQKVPESLGLKLVEADKPVKDEQTKNALIGIVTVRGERNAQMSALAASAIEKSLEELAKNHRQLQNKEGLNLGEIKEKVERAKAYIDAINEAKKENKKQ
jgi:hypothetical protein